MAQLGVQVNTNSLRDFLRACDQANTDTARQMQTTFKRVGEIVRGSAASRMIPKHAPSAAGYRARVQPRGLRVEQSRPKTTGQHPQWGSWQMRHALLPALYRNLGRVDREFAQGIEKVCDRFEAG